MNLRLSASKAKSARGECPYEPGDEIPESGIYEVCHREEEARTAFFLHGRRFPVCQYCDREVRYRMVRSVPYIYEDEDFKK